MKTKLIAAMFSAIMTFSISSICYADVVMPTVHERSWDVNGGEIAMFTGINFSNITSARIKRLDDEAGDVPAFRLSPDWDKYNKKWQHDSYVVNGKELEGATVLEAVQMSAYDVKFVIPEDWEFGVYSVQLLASDGTTNDIININQPQVDWVQSDLGAYIGRCDSWFRITGKTLAHKNGDKKPKVAIVNEKNEVVEIVNDITIKDNYSIEMIMPSNIPVGNYKIYVHNGYGDETAWSEPMEFEVRENLAWRETTEVFDITSYGAVANDNIDDTAAVEKAIAAANAAGGGIVYVPRGRFITTKTIEILPYVQLKGMGKNISQIILDSSVGTDGSMISPMFHGVSDFSVEDLHLCMYEGSRIVEVSNNDYSNGNVYVKNNTLEGRTAKASNIDEYVSRWRYFVSQSPEKTQQGVVKARGLHNFIFENNDVVSDVGMGWWHMLRGVVARNNRFTGYNPNDKMNRGLCTYSTRECIFEENYNIMDSAFGTLNGSSVGHHVNRNNYIARNTYIDDFCQDRESITSDGGNWQPYMGVIESVSEDGTVITLAKDLNFQWTDEYNELLKGTGVFTSVDGSQGDNVQQVRQFVSYNAQTRELVIDSPFNTDVKGIMLTDTHVNMYIIENSLDNVGVISGYGRFLGHVIDGNEFKQASGITHLNMGTYAARGYGGHYAVLNNVFKNSMTIHAEPLLDKPLGRIPVEGYAAYDNISGYMLQTFQDTSSVIVKGNTFADRAMIKMCQARGKMMGVLIENNLFSDGRYGFMLYEQTPAGRENYGEFYGMLLYKNKYKNVITPYCATAERFIFDDKATASIRVVE